MIREKVEKLPDHGIIHPSKSPWVAQVPCIQKKEGMLRLCGPAGNQ